MLNGCSFALGDKVGCHTSMALFRTFASTHEHERSVQGTKLLQSKLRIREFYGSILIVYVAKGGKVLVPGTEALIEFLSRKSGFCGSRDISNV